MNRLSISGALNMMSATVLLLSAMLANSAVHASEKGTVSVEADKLSINSRERVGHFEGNVEASAGGLRFRCDKMVVRYTEDSRLLTLEATGNVVVSQEGSVVRAGKAVLSGKGRLLLLTGSPTLQRGGSTLAGESIEVDLKTGRVEVKKARGKFVIGLGEAG